MSPFRALVRPRGRTRPVVAAATVAVLAAAAAGVGVTAPADPARAADALSCDQNTLYATGGQGQFVAIDATTHAVRDVIAGTPNPFSPANNGLGVARNGVDAFAFTNGAQQTNSSGNVLARYNAASGAVTTVADANPAGAPANVLRGAVNPVTGIYYYATGGDPSVISAYDPATGTKIGPVGRIPALQAGNGDFAFSTRGLLFVVASNAVYSLKEETIPTTRGTGDLPATKLTDLPGGTNSPGIAFSSDGYLYVSTGTTIVKLDSSSGQQAERFTTTPPTTSNVTAYTDLASCNYANTLTGKVDVEGRWKTGDQFTLTVDGGGLSTPATGTTAGQARGVQAQKAGAALAIPARTYTVTQTPSGTTRLADYDTTWSCTDVNSRRALGSGTGTRASLVFPAATSADGTDVDCTFVNTVAAVSASASDDTGSTTAGTPLRVAAPGVLANDAGTDLQVTANSAPAHGTATVAPDGSYVYEPAEGFSGTDSFTYTTKDGGGGTSTSTVTVTVTPTAVDDTADARSGEALVVGADRGVLANDRGTGLTAVVADGPGHGTVVLGRDGSYRYVPEAGFSGTDSFTYTATDASGQVVGPRTVTITVAPSASDDAVRAVSGRASTITSAQLFANDSGTGLRITAVSTPGHGTATVSPAGDVVYTPERTFSGTDTFTYTVTDDSGRTATATVTVTVGPDAVADTATATAGRALDVPAGEGLLANDAGTGPLTAALADGRGPQHGTVVVNPDGSYVYTPADGYSGPDSFEYVLTDGTGATATGTVTVTVAPRAVDDAYTVDSDGTVAKDAPGVLDNDRGTGLVPTITVAPQHGTATIDPDGAFSYVPADGWSGDDTVTYQVTDASGGTSTATVTVTVLPTAADDLLRTPADTRVPSGPTTGLLVNDHGTGLRVTAHDDPRSGTVTVAEDGTWSYLPDAGTSGTDSFRYTVTDASGRTASARAWVIVGDVATDDVATARAGQALTVPAERGVLANDRGTRLTATLDAAPQHGTVELARDGSYVYTPRDGFSGTDSFTYTATDAEGQTATGLVTVTVLPDAVDDVTRTAAGTPVTVGAPGVLGNDRGSDLTAAVIDAPAHGTATVAPGGTVTYVPADGFSGTDTFTYRATDGEGGSDVATVTVHVGPIVVDDESPEGGTVAGQPLVVPAGQGVLANDRGTGLTVAPTEGQGPRAGTVDLRPDGSYTYVPAPGTSGRDTFGYTVTDGNGNAATGTVTVVVRPVAVDDLASVDAGRTVTVPAPGVLGNDVGTGLTAAVTAAPQHGTVTIAPDGTFTYAPEDGFSGTDTLSYTVTDRDGGTATATVTVTVAPRAVDDAYETPADTTLVVPARGVLANDLGTRLTVTSVGTPAHGTATVGADGALRYVPDAGTSGTDRFTYQVTDASGRTATATVTVLVGARATDDAGTTRAGERLTVDVADGVLANDSGTGLAATLDAAPQHGSVELARDGSYAYVPADGFSGLDAFTYTATDAQGQTRTGRVEITVTPVAVDDATSTTAGTPRAVAAPGVLGNDLGSDLRVATVGTAAHGTVTIDGAGALVYSPADGFSGVDTVEYGIVDGEGGTDVATVTVTVGVAAADDSGTTVAGRTLTVDAASGALADDRGTDLTAALADGPTHGTVTLAADGSYVYVPAAGFTGTDSFTYVATDASGQTATATVTITVLGAATATDDTARGETGRPTTVDVTANDAPTEGATFDRGTVVVVDPATKDGVSRLDVPGQGTWTVVDGQVVFTPAAGSDGRASVAYRVTDTAGVTVEATVTVRYPLVLTPAQLAFTGGASVLGTAAFALLGVALGLGLARRRRGTGPVTGPVTGRRRSGDRS